MGYKTSALTAPYTLDEILDRNVAIDTVVVFDPISLEEKINIVRKQLSVANLKTCHTRQAIYFDNKTGRLHTCLIAVAPVLSFSNTNGDILYKQPVAWIRMDDVWHTALSAKQPSVSWAATLQTNATPLDLSQLKVVKGGLNLRQYLYDEAFSGQYKIEDGHTGFGSRYYLSQMEIKEIYDGSVDTIITFDPGTYEETLEVVRFAISPADLNHCQLVQDWYYLPEKKWLANRLKAIAPVIETSDSDGHFLYYRALYFIGY